MPALSQCSQCPFNTYFTCSSTFSSWCPHWLHTTKFLLLYVFLLLCVLFMSSPFVYQSCHTDRMLCVQAWLLLYVPSSINLWVEALIIIIRLFLELFCSLADDPFQPAPGQQPAGNPEQTAALPNRIAQARMSAVDDTSDQLGYLTGMRSVFGRVT